MIVLAWLLVALAFIAWHAALWSGACFIVARTSGWRALVQRYPHPPHPDTGERANGMLMIGEKWSGSVIVHADADGLAVGPAPLMRPGHAHFLLPWETIAPLPATNSPVIRSTNIDVAGQPLSFYGSAADLVARALLAERPKGGIE